MKDKWDQREPPWVRGAVWPLSKQKEVLVLLWSPAWAVPKIQGRCTKSRSYCYSPCWVVGRVVDQVPSFCKESGSLGLEGWIL